jgi:hypothetical protein
MPAYKHQRLLPRQTRRASGTSSLADGVKAAVADPLWFLARQWQLGEFEAGNGGAPVNTIVEYADDPLTQIGWGTNPVFEPIRDPELPLEATVEGGNTGNSFDPAELPRRTHVDAGTATDPMAGVPPGWDPERLEYRFSIRSSGTTELTAKDYDGDHLDWYTFSAKAIAPPAIATPMDQTPTPVRFRGMPRARWWELEDARIDLGDLSRPDLDLLTPLLIEYALLYSADWYVVATAQPVGTLRTVRRVAVVDSFGVSEDIPPLPAHNGGGFAMFTLSGQPSSHHLLINAKLSSSQGAALEDVLFVRDEDANLVWAIERGCYDAPDHTHPERVERIARAAEQPPTAPAAPAGAALAYRAAAPLPEHWIPYVPGHRPQRPASAAARTDHRPARPRAAPHRHRRRLAQPRRGRAGATTRGVARRRGSDRGPRGLAAGRRSPA